MNLILKLRILEKFGSQANFAEALKVDESLVSRVVRGRRVLLKEAQMKWAQGLTCEVGEIFPPPDGGNESPIESRNSDPQGRRKWQAHRQKTDF